MLRAAQFRLVVIVTRWVSGFDVQLIVVWLQHRGRQGVFVVSGIRLAFDGC